MKPSDATREELYGESGVKIIGMVIGSIIGVLGMLAIVWHFCLLLSNTFDPFLSTILAFAFFIIGMIVFLKLLESIYFLICPDKKPESLMDLEKRYEEMEKNRIEYEEIKKRKKQTYKGRDIGDPIGQKNLERFSILISLFFI